jgi:hypothetical protein
MTMESKDVFWVCQYGHVFSLAVEDIPIFCQADVMREGELETCMDSVLFLGPFDTSEQAREEFQTYMLKNHPLKELV